MTNQPPRSGGSRWGALPPAGAAPRAAPDEERHIAAQLRTHALQHLVGHTRRTEQPQRQQHGGGVAAAAPQSRLRRDVLFQLKAQIRHGAARLREEQTGRAERQIALIRRYGGVGAGHGQTALTGGETQRVAQIHGLHDGGHLVVAVIAAGTHGQGKVHLGVGV